MIRSVICVVLLAALAGCVNLPSAGDPLRVIAPSVDITAAADWPAADWTLLVQRPAADQMRGSARIVVRGEGSRLSYYPGLMWVDDVPNMLQSLMIRSFVDSGRLGGVARPGAARGSRLLALDLRHFELVEAADGTLSAIVEWHANLLDTTSSAIVAARVVHARAPLLEARDTAIASAFETALQEALAATVAWTLSHGSPATPAAHVAP